MIRFFALGLLFWTAAVNAAPPKYMNLRSQFEAFIQKGQNQDFESQLQLWQSEIESALPDVYSSLQSSNPNKTPDEMRRERAVKWFPFLFEHSGKILAQFDKFDQVGWPMVQRLADSYPDVDFGDVRVVVVPSLMSFNGRVDEVNGHSVAMFGVDFLELVDQNPKLIEGADLINDMAILVSHEFTHVLHDKVTDFDESSGNSNVLFVPLWKEGMAQMHSQMLAPGTDLTTVLMERNLAGQCRSDQVASWAVQFLQDSKVTSENELNSNYSKWFLMNSKVLGVSRAGYCLGYHTVLAAMRDHSFNELLRMKATDAYVIIKRALEEIAKGN